MWLHSEVFFDDHHHSLSLAVPWRSLIHEEKFLVLRGISSVQNDPPNSIIKSSKGLTPLLFMKLRPDLSCSLVWLQSPVLFPPWFKAGNSPSLQGSYQIQQGEPTFFPFLFASHNSNHQTCEGVRCWAEEWAGGIPLAVSLGTQGVSP